MRNTGDEIDAKLCELLLSSKLNHRGSDEPCSERE